MKTAFTLFIGKYVFPGLCTLLILLSGKVSGQTIVFDDFSYTGNTDPAIASFNKWQIVNNVDGPIYPATYTRDNVTFAADPANTTNSIMNVVASCNNQTSSIKNGRIQTNGYEYVEGTYAARVYFDNGPATYRDGSIQTFYSIVSHLLAEDQSKYSEVDFEYLPYDVWGVPSNKNMYMTSYNSYTATQLNKSYVSSVKDYGSGWHTLIYSFTDKVNVKFWIDGVYMGSVAYTDDGTGRTVYPRSPMQVAFANWLWYGGSQMLGSSTVNRSYTMKVDWFLYVQGSERSPAQVDQLINEYRSNGVLRRNLAGQVHQVTVTQNPFGSAPAPIPGKIEAENYDTGGQGVALNDVTSANEGGAYRSDAVDVEACTDAGAGYNVGYIQSGEWLEYTVNVTAGTYKLDARVAATTAGRTFHVELDGQNISGTISVPNTGGWQNWQTVSVNTASLTAGKKVLRIVMDGAEFNLNYISFTPIVSNKAPTATIASPASGTSYAAPATITINATAADEDGTINKVEFYNGASKLGEDLTQPYSIQWNSVGAGTYTITAKAIDNNNASATSAPITVIVNTVNAQTPYSGSPVEIPGRVEAENFDNGGQGIAFNELTAANEGGAYRSTPVDIEPCTEGGTNIGYVLTGEWLEYTVKVNTQSVYRLEARVAATVAGKTFHVELDGQNISGTIAVPNTGGWQQWQTVTVVTPSLTVGEKVMRIVMDSYDFNINYINFSVNVNQAPTVSITSPVTGASFIAPASVTISASASDDGNVTKVEFFNGSAKLGEDLTAPYSLQWNNIAAGTYNITARATDNNNVSTTSTVVTISVSNQSPYGGTARQIPGRIEAEHYDIGGQGIAFNDLTTANQGAAFRSEAVDVETCTEGGYNIGYVLAGEWVEYSVNVATAGIYTLQVRVAAITSGKTFHIEMDGQNISGTITVPNTGAWQVWQTVTHTTTSLTAGPKIMRIVMDSPDFNINYVQFSTAGMKIAIVQPGALKPVDVYPNPAFGSATIRLNTEEISEADVTIIDVSGTEVFKGKIVDFTSDIDLSSMNSGVYIIRVEASGNTWYEKLIKQ